MRLGINGFFWNLTTTGSGQYTHQLLRGLSKLSDRPRCLLFRPRSSEPGPPTAQPTVDVEEHLLRPPFPLNRDLSKVWFEQISLPSACRNEGVDLIHVPYFAPPLMGGDKTVVTVHDLIPLILPAYRGSALVRAYTKLVTTGARRAAAIVTDSRSSREDILRLLRVDPARVRVVYLAADDRFKPVRDSRQVQRVRQKYGLPEEYVLYLGGFDQRKNLSTLVAAYAAVDADLSREAPLVIAGRLPATDSDFFPDPRLMVQSWNLQDRVVFTGWVAEEDKPALYSGAALFVFPSLYEGFGLTILEAMSCGTAVVASSSSSLPEIAGEAALLFDPCQTEELAEAVNSLLRNKTRREELAARGLERARLFSTEKMISQMMQVYESVMISSQSIGETV